MSEIFDIEDPVVFSLATPIEDAMSPFQIIRDVVLGNHYHEYEIDQRPFGKFEFMRFIYTGQPFVHVIESFNVLSPEREAAWIKEKERDIRIGFDIKNNDELTDAGKDLMKIELHKELMMRSHYPKIEMINDPLLFKVYRFELKRDGNVVSWQTPKSDLADYRLFD